LAFVCKRKKTRGGKRPPLSRRNGVRRLSNGGRRSVGAGRKEAATECRPPEEKGIAPVGQWRAAAPSAAGTEGGKRLPPSREMKTFRRPCVGRPLNGSLLAIPANGLKVMLCVLALELAYKWDLSVSPGHVFIEIVEKIKMIPPASFEDNHVHEKCFDFIF